MSLWTKQSMSSEGFFLFQTCLWSSIRAHFFSVKFIVILHMCDCLPGALFCTCPWPFEHCTPSIQWCCRIFTMSQGHTATFRGAGPQKPQEVIKDCTLTQFTAQAFEWRNVAWTHSTNPIMVRYRPSHDESVLRFLRRKSIFSNKELSSIKMPECIHSPIKRKKTDQCCTDDYSPPRMLLSPPISNNLTKPLSWTSVKPVLHSWCTIYRYVIGLEDKKRPNMRKVQAQSSSDPSSTLSCLLL